MEKSHNDDEPKLEAKHGDRPDLAWSKPEADVKDTPSTPFSLLPFLKKKPAGKGKALFDKKKIQQSRQEILRLIKGHESSKQSSQPPTVGWTAPATLLSRAGQAGRGFLARLKEKLIKRPSHKEVLIDYQKVFAEEKNKRNLAALTARPEIKAASLAPEPTKQAKQEIRQEVKQEIKQEIKPAVKISQPAKVAPAAEIESEPAPLVLETNLIKGEIVSYFDWQKKIFTLVGAFLIPVFLVGVVYLGLMFYQRESQAKNLALVKKFNELTDEVKREETGAAQILSFQDELKVTSEVFGQHIYWTNFFKFLEDNTIKDVYFTGFAGDTGGGYSLNALANNYGNIAEQVNILKNNKKVTAVEAAGGELVSGDIDNATKVKFVLSFSILKSIFTE